MILKIRPLTAKNHAQKILRKLGVLNRTQAVATSIALRVLPAKKSPGVLPGVVDACLGRKEGKTPTRSNNSGSSPDPLSRKPDFVVATRRSEVVARLQS